MTVHFPSEMIFIFHKKVLLSTRKFIIGKYCADDASNRIGILSRCIANEAGLFKNFFFSFPTLRETTGGHFGVFFSLSCRAWLMMIQWLLFISTVCDIKAIQSFFFSFSFSTFSFLTRAAAVQQLPDFSPSSTALFHSHPSWTEFENWREFLFYSFKMTHLVKREDRQNSFRAWEQICIKKPRECYIE